MAEESFLLGPDLPLPAPAGEPSGSPSYGLIPGGVLTVTLPAREWPVARQIASACGVVSASISTLPTWRDELAGH